MDRATKQNKQRLTETMMTTTQPSPTTPTSVVPFALGCVPARLLLAYLVAGGHVERVRALAAVAAAVVGLGFLSIHAMGWRKSGPETFGGPIWWDRLRPVHGVMYLAVAVLVATGHDRSAAAVLLGDVAVGVTGSVRHRYYHGDYPTTTVTTPAPEEKK
jgi:hypothetical protein